MRIATTGHRIRLGLTVDAIDFLRREVRVDRHLLTRPGKHTEFGPPKAPASVRTILPPQGVVGALAAQLAAYPAGEHGLVFTVNVAPINVWHLESWGPGGD